MDEVKTGLLEGADGVTRCFWPGALPDYLHYHDHEWGRPVADDIRLFEKICLEGFQSGLSWLTILRKRESFREAFAGFDFERVAEFGEADIERLLGNAGIVRHRGKIESTINNARRAAELIEREGSFAAFIWRFAPSERPPAPHLALTPESSALSKALKGRGFTFVGPTTVYAFMQGVGIVNDHIEGCACRDAVEAERRAFKRPA
jgi:DNA-3-methyladenine glycosylase I